MYLKVLFQYTGMMLSACLPFHKNGDDFMGVTCIDMLMRDLVGELTSFQQGEIAYTFMLDQGGTMFFFLWVKSFV